MESLIIAAQDQAQYMLSSVECHETTNWY
jgi:hypothetical protein